MGNRAYISLNKNVYYVHWNGGLDTICPMLEAIQSFKNDISYPTEAEIVAAFVEFSGSKMELQTDDRAADWIEENGHYFLKFDDKNAAYIVHRMEKYNKQTEFYDRFSDVILSPEIYFTKNFLPTIKPDYLEEVKTGYPERVKVFKDIFKKLGMERREKEALDRMVRASKLEVDRKKTFKSLIKDDLKNEMPSILPKLKSVRYESFSMGDSVDVVCNDLTKEERNFMENLCKQYQNSRFDSMDDSSHYIGSNKARSAKYVHLRVEYSEAVKEAVKLELKEKRGIVDDKTAHEAYNTDFQNLIWRVLSGNLTIY